MINFKIRLNIAKVPEGNYILLGIAYLTLLNQRTTKL